ncbi:MAG: hypothetical protein DRO88_07415 [Promethearchaeia archaeon]|nr:MAG: hypothetical protein DRO88_07415 [Candidatus Lokiarchaeia archaeon]
MSKTEFMTAIETAFDEGLPFIDFTEFYTYALIPKGDKYLEISYDFEDHEIMENRTLDPAKAYFNFCEEVEKALAEELEIFYLNKWRDFKNSLSGNEAAKLPKLIEELVNNTDTYGNDIPVIKSPEDLAKLKEKL